ncbi:MAG: NAD(P)/FAD-dependent oxidoreductase [Clostridia bacterium]|nr:NAD(P)/FAD-dependent oxidoreductase [Clostridia bacterium]
MKKYDAIVIGAGPAGMMAAGRAAELGLSVLLLEKNNLPGRKLRITGKGRCNITNNADISEFFQNIPRNPKFLYSALYNFTGQDAISFFEAFGVPCKVERGQRVFPVSDRAHDVAEALFRYVKSGKCDYVQCKVKDILYDEGKVTGVLTDKGKFDCNFAVVATGGKSYPLTGSTGDGYRFAQKVGHTIVEPKGALVPMESKDTACKALQGLTLKNVAVTLQDGQGKKLGEEFGEMLFAHFGVTGPVILSLSSFVPQSESWKIVIDLKPALSAEQLDARVLRDFAKFSNKQLINALQELLPKKMIPAVLQKAELDERKPVHSVTKEERIKLITVLKSFEIECYKLRPIDEAIITSGGVSVKEVNPSTMESKKVQGLYFVGEVLDVDAFTGGFNLQIAYATARLCGESMAEKKEEF